MDGLMKFMENSVLTSDEKISKFSEAMRKLKADVKSGKAIISPKTPEEYKVWERQRAETEVQSFNAEVGREHEIDGYHCELCKDRGMIAEMAEDDYGCRAVYRQCRCRAIRTFIRKAKKSGLTDVMKKYTFSAYQAKEDWQKQLKAAAERFVKDDAPRWFFIGGQSGSGKTHLCTAICTCFLRQNRNVRYMMWRDESSYIKSVVNDPERYREAVQGLKKVDILYIDDLFKMGRNQMGEVPRPTTADINLAFEILNDRYNGGRITVLSSERQIGEILEIDAAVGGRIYEMATPGGYALNIKDDAKKNYRTKAVVTL